MTYDYCIWDFNGTLLDDVTTCISSVNTLLEARGLPVVKDVEQYRKIFRFPVIEYYKTLGFDFEKEPYDKLAIEWVSLYLENVRQAGLYDDAENTLRQFREHGVKQSVLSATEASMLKGQLDSLGISGYFEQTMGLDNIHAGSKLSLAYEWRQNHTDSKVLFIGDTDHDVDTARALGADCVLVCRGHQSREYLLSMGVTVVDSLDTLCNMVFK